MKKFVRFVTFAVLLIVILCGCLWLYNNFQRNTFEATYCYAGATVAAIVFLFGLALGGGDAHDRRR